jgi:hypothetical protein
MLPIDAAKRLRDMYLGRRMSTVEKTLKMKSAKALLPA